MKRRLYQFLSFFIANAHLKGFTDRVVYQGTSKGLCIPFLNCYACPGALFSCPLGALQHYLVIREIPFYIVGFLGTIGAVVGRMACGWLCPFGLLQDLLYKINSLKIKIPRVLTYFKYVVLVGLILVIPFVTGEHWFSKLCPMGLVVGGLPWALISPEIRALVRNMFMVKMGITAFIMTFSVVSKRPFCRIFCPLGAIYALFNAISIYRLEADVETCLHCNKCQRVCPVDIKVYENANSPECIRCLECVQACPTKAVRFTHILKGRKTGRQGIEIPEPDLNSQATN